jgi:hypothetical protein
MSIPYEPSTSNRPSSNLAESLQYDVSRYLLARIAPKILLRLF